MLEIKETKAIAPKLTNLKNDIFTHFLYHDPDDPNTFFFFKLVIEKFLHLQCIKIKVLNPQLSLASVDKGIHNKTTKYGLPTY